MRNEEWMEFREEALNASRERDKRRFRLFLKEMGFSDTFAYDYDAVDNKFTIYTSKPGEWIGPHGKNVDILKKLLSTEGRENCEVAFKEIRGRFISIE